MFSRTITIALLAACITAPLLADEEYTQAQIRGGILKYSRREKITVEELNDTNTKWHCLNMEKRGRTCRNVGFGFMGAGAAATIVGLIILPQEEAEFFPEVSLIWMGAGGLGLIAGMITAITGGLIKYKYHQKRIDLEKRLSIRYTVNGMAVVFDF